jgi:hypothetical protein
MFWDKNQKYENNEKRRQPYLCSKYSSDYEA